MGGKGGALTSLDTKDTNRFKCRQNAPCIYRPCFHFFGSSKSFQIPPQETIYHPCFHFFAVPNRLKYHQNACFRDIVFKRFSSVPNRFQYRQNACFRNIVFKTISSVPNRFKYRHNSCVRGIMFSTTKNLQFQIVSNIVRMHALEALFSCFPCSSKSFQIPSDCMC